MQKTQIDKLLFIATLLMLTSCGQSTDSKIAARKPPIPQAALEGAQASDQAVAFINAYVANCNKKKGAVEIAQWVDSYKLTTTRFKTELKKLLADAYREDPELGLDADPIVDAQDYPDKGFELDSFDGQTNYVIVKGKNWPDFKLTMKMVLENNNWLVDGCGIINMPVTKRITRK
ncbi:hypothetical protein [Hymenobacter bucti]|uniref:DUF3828 domain-containing protein n=1 Tax=Hymenobacter bucti TaxID=1844114 RepID=A0ABW4QZ71_9BACT